MAGPSPDLSMVTLRWAGTYLDGSPATGTLMVEYDGGVQLDDSVTVPLNVFPSVFTVQIKAQNILIDGVTRTVGYAEFPVPASNDPDMLGSGGTYRLTENLSNGGGRRDVSFIADIDTPGGVIWLNKIIPTTPMPGAKYTSLSVAEFVALTNRVGQLETAPPPITSYTALTGKPPIPSKPADIGAQPAGDYATNTALTGKAAATHTHTADSITDGTTNKAFTAAEKTKLAGVAAGTTTSTALGERFRYVGAYAASVAYIINDVISTPNGRMFFALQTHTSAGAAPTVDSVYWKTLGGGPAAVSYDTMPAGFMFAIYKKADGTWPARTSARTDLTAFWIGPGDAAPAGMIEGDMRSVTP